MANAPIGVELGSPIIMVTPELSREISSMMSKKQVASNQSLVDSLKQAESGIIKAKISESGAQNPVYAFLKKNNPEAAKVYIENVNNSLKYITDLLQTSYEVTLASDTFAMKSKTLKYHMSQEGVVDFKDLAIDASVWGRFIQDRMVLGGVNAPSTPGNSSLPDIGGIFEIKQTWQTDTIKVGTFTTGIKSTVTDISEIKNIKESIKASEEKILLTALEIYIKMRNFLLIVTHRQDTYNTGKITKGTFIAVILYLNILMTEIMNWLREEFGVVKPKFTIREESGDDIGKDAEGNPVVQQAFKISFDNLAVKKTSEDDAFKTMIKNIQKLYETRIDLLPFIKQGDTEEARAFFGKLRNKEIALMRLDDYAAEWKTETKG
jgi:hypothetical protein